VDAAIGGESKNNTINGAAERLEDQASFPGNWLEALKADREGQHSMGINNQWRICFVWRDLEAHEVEIVDCH
jgi:proteic killer suppression protein